jgi:hypothetical protein
MSKVAPLDLGLNAQYPSLLAGIIPDCNVADRTVQFLQSQPILIYGAGRAGKVLFRLFTYFGIQTQALVDKRHHPIGSIDGVPVKTPQYLREIDLQTNPLIVLGAGGMQLAEMIAQDLAGLNCSLDYINGVYLTFILQFQECSLRAKNKEYPDVAQCASYHGKPHKCPIFCEHVESLALRDNPVERGARASLNSVGYQLGAVRTIQCEHCLEAVPLLDSSKRLSRETIVKDLRKLLSSCKFLHRLDIVGGEPFSHPEITESIQNILTIPKIGYVAVFTNGTRLPRAELCDVLRSDRVYVSVSDYGECLPAKVRKTIAVTLGIFNNQGLKILSYPDRYWVDISGFEKYHTPDAEHVVNFSHCFLAACHRMYEGTLHHCAYQCNGVKPGKFAKKDAVDIHTKTTKELITELNDFDRTPFIKACRYCNIPKGVKAVITGKQIVDKAFRL